MKFLFKKNYETIFYRNPKIRVKTYVPNVNNREKQRVYIMGGSNFSKLQTCKLFFSIYILLEFNIVY